MYNELSKIGILLRPEPYGQWCDRRRLQVTPQAENSKPEDTTVAQKIAPMFACYGKTHALLNDYIR